MCTSLRGALLMAFVLMGFYQTPILAQSILKRHVLCSSGKSLTNSTLYQPFTFGQPPACKTLTNGDAILRQGFQQPFGSADPSCAAASFSVETALGGACGDSYTVVFTGSANSDAEITWDFGAAGSPSTAEGLEVENITFSQAGLQYVTLTVVQNGCTQTAAKAIQVSNPSVGGSAITTPVLCFGGATGTANLQVTGGQPPYVFDWGNGINPIGLAAGTFQVTVTDGLACTAQVAVVVTQPDSALQTNILLKMESCVGAADGEAMALVTGGTAPYSYTWSNLSSSNELLGLEKGSFNLLVVDANACNDAQNFEITRYCESGQDSIPTVFSPGGNDGINDIWIIPGIDDFPNNEVLVFNRWGATVYSKKGYTNADGWKGTDSNDKDLVTSAYFYFIQLKDTAGTVFKGSITIIR